MKKYLIFLLLILFSCERDELYNPVEEPQTQLIFDESISRVTDGQVLFFEVSSTEKHQLIVSDKNGNVVTKESFTPQIGLNSRTIYTKVLPKGIFVLDLRDSSKILQSTQIVIE